MRDSLAIIPHDLHQAFEQTIARIEAQSEGRKRLAMNALMWISHAKASLTIRELREALAIKSGKSFLDKTYLPHAMTIVDCCLGLVDIDTETSMFDWCIMQSRSFFEKDWLLIVLNQSESF